MLENKLNILVMEHRLRFYLIKINLENIRFNLNTNFNRLFFFRNFIN